MAALLPALVLASSPASSAGSSSLSFAPCAGTSAFTCASLVVPLDRSATVPGTITLSVERKQAGAAPSRDAVVALAGGPGQAMLPLAEAAAQEIAPALGTRDLLLFDQRGTGTSDPLSCSSLEGFGVGSISQLDAQCAKQLGAGRLGYTSSESVEDIEALRQAGGYEKLVLYGTSYGTKVALDYAERYPQNVEALVLDSVVPATGQEPLRIPTFQAIAPVLDELCANDACVGVTTSAVRDVAKLAAQLHKHSLSGSIYDGAGVRHASRIAESGLFDIIEAGDLNPALRALLPAAVHSALHNDPDPLLRLQLLSEGLVPNTLRASAHTAAAQSQELNEAVFATTICEETNFPWQRTASPATRRSEALAYLHAKPASDFYPFDSRTSFEDGFTTECVDWPDAAPPPPAASPLPNVPTLILSGEQDIRTPTANALGVAAQIPDAQMLVVPFTGHSVIGSDITSCASKAVAAFFAAALVQPCAPTTNVFAPTPVTPTKLAYVRSPAGLSGRPGKTLVAALDTIVDFERQTISATLQADERLPSGSSFGGLRGGYARLTSQGAILHDLSFVPGVELSGAFPVRNSALQTSTIQISGSEASDGTMRIGTGATRVTGTLGGERYSVSVAKVRLSSAATSNWPSPSAVLELLPRRTAGERAGTLSAPWLP
jgi:pimeloyl-ACP methyl ester carboxylesterase